MIEHHYVGRQILIHRAKAISDPRTKARVALPQKSSVHLQQTRAMREAVRVARTNNRHIVDVTGQIGEQVGNLDPRLAMPGELVSAGEQRAGIAHLEQGVAIERRDRLASVLIQGRLGIEQIDLARSAVHEQIDASLGPRREMWLLRG